MDIFLKKKTVDEVIGYWIETQYLHNQIANMMEYADEVSEHYDMYEWLRNDANTKRNSVMSITHGLRENYNNAYEICKEAEDKLKTVMTAGIENGDEIYAAYKGENLIEQLDDLMDYLIERFDEIYDYAIPDQIEKFYKVLEDCLKNMD